MKLPGVLYIISQTTVAGANCYYMRFFEAVYLNIIYLVLWKKKICECFWLQSTVFPFELGYVKTTGT